MTHDKPADTPENWLAQGTAHAARGEFEQALDCFEAARLLQPSNPAVLVNLGETLTQLRRLIEALPRYREASALMPDDAGILHGIGWVLEQMRELEEAVVCYRQAVQLNPRFDGSYNNLGNCLHILGRFEEAHEAYRRAIEIAPASSQYYRNLAQSKPLLPDDPCFALLEKQLEHPDSLAPHNQAELHFAFGQALADGGQSERALEHILQANALYRRGIQYDETTTLGLFKQLADLLTADLLQAKHGLGDPSESPIFIIGMPRSGSTLIEQILASHPQVFGMGERPDFGHALSNAMTRGADTGSHGIRLDALHALSAAQLTDLGANYVRRIGSTVDGDGPYRRITDKYPYNFIHVGLIHLALPNARFIHSRRSPVETCLSIFSRIFQDVPFSYDLGELGRYYRAYDALMAHWRRVLPQGVMLEVQYEDLVDDLEGNVRRMLAHCGLEWDDRCLSFYQTERQINTASALQVRKPLYRTSLKRWRPPEAMLQPLYDGLGPQLSGDLAGSPVDA